MRRTLEPRFFSHKGIRPWGKAVLSVGRAGAIGRPNSLSLEGEGGRAAWSHPHPAPDFSAASLWPLITAPSSSRLFSLQVSAPPKIFLSLVYKLEGASNVSVALEVTTGDAGSCHVGGISALNGEGMGSAPAFLPGLSPFSGHLGEEESRKVPWVCGHLVLAVSGSPASVVDGVIVDGEVHLSAKSSGPRPPSGSEPPAGYDVETEDIPGVRERPGE